MFYISYSEIFELFLLYYYSRLSVLANFCYLEDLDLWGGAFYTDGLCNLLEQIGHQIKKLNLVHIEELDWNAVAIITVTCPNLVMLGLQNCEFKDETDEGEISVDDEDPFRCSLQTFCNLF